MGRRGKKGGGEGGGGGDGFMVLFATLSLILLAFFIFMKTLSTIEDDRSRRALASIRRNFDLISLGGLYQLFEDQREGVFVAEESPAFRRLEQELQYIVVRQRLGETDDLSVETNDREVRIRIASNVLYGENVVALSPRTFPLLDRVAVFLREMGRPSVVEGHCDPSGGARNWELSALRAGAVARFLDESAGFDRSLLTSRAMAHFHSEGVPDDEARRVEIVIPRTGGPS